MKIKLECPYAYHGELMRVYCKKADGDICYFQFFRDCKGWWVNSPDCTKCKLREEGSKS